MQDTFARACTRPKGQARDDRVSCIHNTSRVINHYEYVDILFNLLRDPFVYKITLYARYLCSRDALGLARATIGYLVYKR